MSLSISVLSEQIVPIPVSLTDGCDCVDVSTFVVEIAFVIPGGSPAPADWHPAAWDTSCGVCNAIAEILIGPGSLVVLPLGTYRPWVRVTAPPEVLVKPSSGYVKIF